ncbi:hypothetical protein GYA19_01275 [Candidatus Beckwithbacteria bacterium]|nr:hypothetical protein [Candidatus Beckwithbacteria bacterium]
MAKTNGAKKTTNTTLLGLHKNNTRLSLPGLGGVEIKYISYGDTQNFLKILGNERLTDKQFVQQILHNQLLKPKLTLKEFEHIPNPDLLAIVNAFVRNEKHTFQYLKKTEDFFHDFRAAIKTYEDNKLKQFAASFKPLIADVQKTLISFNRDYSNIIKQAIDTSSYIKESIKGISEVARQIQQTQLQFIEPLKQATEQYRLMADTITNSLKPQIDFWNKWTEQNKSAFESIGKFWEDFQKQYNIAEQKAVGVLQKYKWFISPSLPITLVFEVMRLDKGEGRQDKAVNKFFVDYFSGNQWANLETMVSNWKDKMLLEKRLKILRNCVLVLKNSSNKKANPIEAILPTLISQIDGLLSDYLNSKEISWQCSYDDYIQGGVVRKIGRKSQFRTNRSKTMTTSMDDLADDIFLNILFQKSQKGQPLETPFNFNRHKIIHGENTSYGRKDYLIRAFLIIDFLVHLK